MLRSRVTKAVFHQALCDSSWGFYSSLQIKRETRDKESYLSLHWWTNEFNWGHLQDYGHLYHSYTSKHPPQQLTAFVAQGGESPNAFPSSTHKGMLMNSVCEGLLYVMTAALTSGGQWLCQVQGTEFHNKKCFTSIEEVHRVLCRPKCFMAFQFIFHW